MKRIEFISPVESMRGNLSGRQSLQYAKNNNPAWDAPDGVNYARNYRPSFIGQRRISATGDKKIFATRTRNAAVLNDTTRSKMAILAGSGAIYNKAMHDIGRLTQLQIAFEQYKEQHPTATMRQWLQPQIQDGLTLKDPDIAIPLAGLNIPNPWVSDQSNVYDIDPTILVKFWPQLATNPVVFTIKGIGTGVAHSEETYADLVASKHNVLGLNDFSESDFVTYTSGTKDYFIVYLSAGEMVFLQKTDAVVAEPLFATEQTPG